MAVDSLFMFCLPSGVLQKHVLSYMNVFDIARFEKSVRCSVEAFAYFRSVLAKHTFEDQEVELTPAIIKWLFDRECRVKRVCTKTFREHFPRWKRDSPINLLHDLPTKLLYDIDIFRLMHTSGKCLTSINCELFMCSNLAVSMIATMASSNLRLLRLPPECTNDGFCELLERCPALFECPERQLLDLDLIDASVTEFRNATSTSKNKVHHNLKKFCFIVEDDAFYESRCVSSLYSHHGNLLFASFSEGWIHLFSTKLDEITIHVPWDFEISILPHDWKNLATKCNHIKVIDLDFNPNHSGISATALGTGLMYVASNKQLEILRLHCGGGTRCIIHALVEFLRLCPLTELTLNKIDFASFVSSFPQNNTLRKLHFTTRYDEFLYAQEELAELDATAAMNAILRPCTTFDDSSALQIFSKFPNLVSVALQHRDFDGDPYYYSEAMETIHYFPAHWYVSANCIRTIAEKYTRLIVCSGFRNSERSERKVCEYKLRELIGFVPYVHHTNTHYPPRRFCHP